MPKKAKFDYPIAVVFWEDAYSNDEWISLEEAKSHKACKQRSVGWLVDESDDHVTIIQTESKDDNLAGARLTIPKPYIRKFETMVGNGRWKIIINDEQLPTTV